MKKYNINVKSKENKLYRIFFHFNFHAKSKQCEACTHAIKMNFQSPIVIFHFYCDAIFITNVNQNRFVIFAFSSFSKTATVNGFSLVHFVLESFPCSLNNNSFTKNLITSSTALCSIFKQKNINLLHTLTYLVPDI